MEECFFIQLSAHTMVPWQCCRNSAHQGTLSRLGTPIPKMLPQKWGLFSHHPGARVLITGLLICNGCPYLHFLLAYFVIAISMGIPLASSRLEYFSLCLLAVCISFPVYDGNLTCSLPAALK